MPKPSILFIVICVTIMIAGLPAGPDAAAARKKKVAAKTQSAKKPAPVPGKRVTTDFTAAYRSPTELKTVKINYIGVARNAVEKRGENIVPVQYHSVSVAGILTECGLKMKNIWEARYYRLETEWIFQDIALKSSAPVGTPSKKLPAIDDTVAKKIISDGIASQYGAPVLEVILLGRKGSWALCVPTYLVTAQVIVATKHDIYNTISTYECIMVSTIAQEKGSWTFVTAGCVYKGGKAPDCHIGTMCRTISQESSIPPISDADALLLMRKSFENEYGLKKSNIAVEKFSIISRLPAVIFGTSMPCVISAVFVIDEYQETTGGDSGTRTAEKVRAAYECTVTGNLRYSLREKRWEGMITSCCAPGAEGCGVSCSTPYKSCRRLGTK